MKELSQPPDHPIAWTFRARVPVPPQVTRDGGRVVKVAEIHEVTVFDRFAFSATRKAAQLLGVPPEFVEHVTT